MSTDSFDQQPVATLKGVGPKNLERLARIGIHSVQDLLFHLPLRYQDRTRVVAIRDLRPGDQAVVEGEVRFADVRMGRRRSLMVELTDGDGALWLRFFHFSRAQREALQAGTRLRCYGEVRQGPHSLELVHPEYRRLEDGEAPLLDESLTPIYPTTEGLHQLTWLKLTDSALALLEARPQGLPEWLPAEVLQRLRLPELPQAVRRLHRPPPDIPQAALRDGQHPAQQRLAFEELLAHQLSLRRWRGRRRQALAPKLPLDGRAQALHTAFLAACRSASPGPSSGWWGRSPPTWPAATPCCGCCRGTWVPARRWWRPWPRCRPWPAATRPP
jgi:ATP-dependent DNA helicase RecG